MSKVTDAQEALAFLMGRLIASDRSVDLLVGEAAHDYDVEPRVVEAWLFRAFPSFREVQEWRSQQQSAEATRKVWDADLKSVKVAAREWAADVWRNCEPDGDPNWNYCCNRFLEAKGVQASRLREAASEIFQTTGKKFRLARDRYLEGRT